MNPFRPSLGISARLGMGFFAVLLLLTLIAGYGIVQINRLGGSFDAFSMRSQNVVSAADLQQRLMTLQASAFRLAALNSKVNQTDVAAVFNDFVQTLDKLPKTQIDAEFDAAMRDFRPIISGPDSLSEIQNKVDAARGKMSEAAVAMSNTVAGMLRDVDQIGDVAAIATVQDRILRARMLVRSYQFTGYEDEINEALAAMRDAERKFDQFDRMDASVAQNPLVKAGRAKLDAMFTGLAAMRKAVSQREVTTTRIAQLGQVIATQIQKQRNDALDAMTVTSGETVATVNNAFWNSTSAAGFAVVVGMLLAFFIGRGITKPIRLMTTAMRRLSQGDLTTQIPGTGRQDEIGEMAMAMQVFKDTAIERKREESEAESVRLESEAARRRIETEAAEHAIAGERGFVIDKFGAGIRGLANGDLTVRLVEVMPGEYERLRHDFNEAIHQLGQTLSAVAVAARSVDSGSREISNSSDDLSKRTEQQAASLEETAAALDEITTNVVNSTQRAEEARSLTLLANSSAEHSAKIVADAVEAMARISHTSSQISNIIGVIDEIAFQTNLLALNAGVEAARAGETGRGFAVVAQEVRELAQRSAKAAKEIKELIRNSNVEVQSGVKLVGDTGDVLRTIAGHIAVVNQHVGAIATSAREQSVGLGEVNIAVNQMDQVTQRNAAMVEETNAASANLATDAATLQDLISGFRLAGSETGSASQEHDVSSHQRRRHA